MLFVCLCIPWEIGTQYIKIVVDDQRFTSSVGIMFDGIYIYIYIWKCMSVCTAFECKREYLSITTHSSVGIKAGKITH